jgi:hypothetical protein
MLPGVCQAAARGGHLEALQWARSKEVQWDGRTRSAGEVLQWARLQGCP